jgi:hypothetical protein
MLTARDLQRPEIRENLLRIYENFYWIHMWIVNVCARWVLKHEEVDKKLDLVEQAWEERNQMVAFKQAIIDLGYEWDKLDHEAYFFSAMKNRYRSFMATEDELEVLIGMNLFSEGVFGYTELEQLDKHSPGLFPKFKEFAEEEARHAEQGRRFLMDALKKQPSLVPHARMLVGKYQKALMETATDPEFSVFLRELVQQGFVGPDVVDCAGVRFRQVFGALALPNS